MLESFKELFFLGTPHYFCVSGNPIILGMEIAGNLLTWLAYLSIPLSIVLCLNHPAFRRPAIALAGPRVVRFAIEFIVFILLCGVTHLMAILTIFKPWFFLSGVFLLLTGIVSTITAIDLAAVLVHFSRAAKHYIDRPEIQNALDVLIAEDREIAKKIFDRWKPSSIQHAVDDMIEKDRTSTDDKVFKRWNPKK